MTFEIYNTTTSQWVDILWAIAYQGADSSRNDVDGPDSGRVLGDALLIRDRLATKYKWNFTTIPIKESEAASIEALLMPEFFQVRTDWYSPGTLRTFTVHSNNVTKAYVINKGNYAMVKLSFPIVQR